MFLNGAVDFMSKAQETQNKYLSVLVALSLFIVRNMIDRGYINVDFI